MYRRSVDKGSVTKMKRNVDLKEISDGKLYGSNDLVKADCGSCEGCFACCCGMGQSIILDPLDVHRLSKGLNQNFEALLASYLELNVVDGIILPNLRMQGERECCAFLNAEGRCKIHSFRPGICRLFPLGRYYANGGFQYFLQTNECRKQNRTKVKVKKWIDTPEFNRYEDFVNKWHYYLKDMEALIARQPEKAREIDLQILQRFYLTPYGDDFYTEFEERMKKG